jgi:uncharacterized protein (DUF362 family)
MDPNARKPKVILRHCDTYDALKIRKIIREGLEELGLRPSGRTLAKPNLVAAGPLFEHAHTRPEFVEGVLLALRDRDGGMTELAVGERCGITIPSRMAFEASGVEDVSKRLGVKQYFFEEEPQVEIPLRHEGRLRDYLFTPEPVAKADFFVNMPKFKAHPWTTVTFSMKNYIGIQDDRHRLIDHDHRLNEKVADLQYVVQPKFIAIDAIIAGEGRMLTPKPFPLNMIIMGNNQAAFDAVCSRIIGVDPHDVEHLEIASRRGFGPLDLEHIELSGDVTFEEARKRARGFEVGLVRVEKYFEGSQITAYAGPPPEAEHSQYCWGGCPGAMEEAIELLRLFDEQVDTKMPRIHIVFGKYEGPIDAKPGEKVVFIGDCAEWEGNVAGELVQIRNVYKDRATKDPHEAKHDDIYAKMVGVTTKLAMSRGKSHIRLTGCPVSVAEQVLTLVGLTPGAKNPYFDGTQIIEFNKAYLSWRAAAAAKRLRGIPYQRPGHCHRGDGAPVLDERTAKYLHGEGDAEE